MTFEWNSKIDDFAISSQSVTLGKFNQSDKISSAAVGAQIAEYACFDGE